jgi:hypothetical protein
MTQRGHTGKKRKRELSAKGVSTSGVQPASQIDPLSTLTPDVFDKWDRIAGPEALARLWHCLLAKRGSPLNKNRESTLDTSTYPETSIEGLLTRFKIQYQSRINALSKESVQFTEVPWRLYLADIASLYIQELAVPRKERQRRAKMRGNILDTARTSRKSVKEIFIDSLLPELITGDGNRHQAKTKFDRWIQHGKRWAKLIGGYGVGIMLLIPQDLTDNM